MVVVKRKITAEKGRFMQVNAPIFRRILAFIVDLIIINLFIVSPYRSLFEKILPTESFMETFDLLQKMEGNLGSIYIIIMLVIISILCYFIILEKILGQTLGKRLMDIYVVDIEGRKLSIWQLFARSMFLIPVLPFMLLWIVDPVFTLFNKDNQRFMEYLTKSKTVYYIDKNNI